MSTAIKAILPWRLGCFKQGPTAPSDLPLEDWDIELSTTEDANALRDAALRLRTSNIPVAFPTETVYGLGADATRSEAVRGIYAAKQRPSDNPLIVHIASIKQLRSLLLPPTSPGSLTLDSGTDPIPHVYHALIRKFWPGPLTILLPVPDHSPLAAETTAGLKTFGARMPADLLALSLIKVADRPIAAPSANASTKPSPTAAEHVLYDLEGRIELILDGGPCAVGVESTVVDGLCDPPCVLRPGGISIGQLRQVDGWRDVRAAYEHRSGAQPGQGPRAPGMKYRHYSPKARVHLFEAGRLLDLFDLSRYLGSSRRIGLVRTKQWLSPVLSPGGEASGTGDGLGASSPPQFDPVATGFGRLPSSSPLARLLQEHASHKQVDIRALDIDGADDVDGVHLYDGFTIYDASIGPSTSDIARSLFNVLRELDKRDLDAIVVEGIADDEDDISAAVMNRLRKASEVAS